jgi:hypothetical protein
MRDTLIILIYILIFAFAPFATIWAINTLFFSGPLLAYAIPYTAWTWMATILLGLFLRAQVKSK